MKKIFLILFVLLMICGCTKNKESTSETTQTTVISSGNDSLYQDWAEVPLLTDDSYLDFYFEYKDSNMDDNHSELYCCNYWNYDDMLYHFKYESRDEDTFTLREKIYGIDDGIKYDEMLQTRYYDMSISKDESYWLDYDDNGEIICVSLSIMEYGNHAPYSLISAYDINEDKFTCDKNEIKDEYPDDGQSAIKDFLANFVKETIDAEKIIADFESDLYFYYSDMSNNFSYYLGPNSLKMNLMSINIDENGRYIYAYLASGNDCKLYLDDENRVIEIKVGTSSTTYEYADEYVIATYQQKEKDDVVYKYDYNRNQIIE